MTAHGERSAVPSDGSGSVPPIEARTAPPIEAKSALRLRLIAARRVVAPEVRAERAAALARAACLLVDATGGPVCAYLPVGSEPGSVAGLDALVAAGHEVLLPVVPGAPGPLDWARYDGPASLAPGPLGLREPTGPRRGVAAITAAGLVIVPALAVDRHGTRLGRGGGYYDRTLPLAGAGVVIAAMIGDDELLDELPAEEHDVAVTVVLRPTTGVTRLAAEG